MAGYAKAGRRKSEKKTVITFVVGILAFVLLFVGIVFLTQAFKNELDYKDFSNNYITDVSKIKTQSEEKYVVYLYTSNSNSESIKDKVLEFAKENAQGIKVYFIDYSTIDDEEDTNYNADKLKELATLLDTTTDKLSNAVPALFCVKDGSIVGRYKELTKITGSLNDIAKGGYTKFNE